VSSWRKRHAAEFLLNKGGPTRGGKKKKGGRRINGGKAETKEARNSVPHREEREITRKGVFREIPRHQFQEEGLLGGGTGEFSDARGGNIFEKPALFNRSVDGLPKERSSRPRGKAEKMS